MGTQLEKIEAEILASEQTIYLHSFKGEDASGTGYLSMEGEVRPIVAERFPFHLDGVFTNLTLAEVEWAHVEANGTFQVVGDLHSARISGETSLIKSNLSIPERLPNSLPATSKAQAAYEQSTFSSRHEPHVLHEILTKQQ